MECTCTLVWLKQFSYEYSLHDENLKTYIDTFDDTNRKEEMGCFLNETVYFLFKRECDFEQKFSKCHDKKQDLTRIGGDFLENMNLLYNLKWLQYVIAVFFQPLICLLSLATNLMCVLVLRNRRTHELSRHLSSHLYKHMLANVLFNVAYSSIKLASLMNICIFERTSFCSRIYTRPAPQYFKIYGDFFAGNALRISMNVSYLAFSLSRFLSTSSHPSRFAKRFQHLNIALFYSVVVTTSLALSLFKVFEFSVNTNWYFDLNFPLDAYGPNYCNDQMPQSQA